MSDNTALIRRVYAALAAGDVQTVLDLFASDIHWVEAEGFPYGGLYIGPEQVLENVFAKLGTEWEGFAAVPSEYVAERDMVVAMGTYSGTYKATGKSFKTPMVHVWRVRDGSIVEFHQHTDTAVVLRSMQ
ncbi:MAG: nuclear transport factor 2 family protein [Krumholzibacteria bacterium]|nr:nuclear transport factor 2 family protein [Candidatus Krumholzibacteria bacterium]